MCNLLCVVIVSFVFKTVSHFHIHKKLELYVIEDRSDRKTFLYEHSLKIHLVSENRY